MLKYVHISRLVKYDDDLINSYILNSNTKYKEWWFLLENYLEKLKGDVIAVKTNIDDVIFYDNMLNLDLILEFDNTIEIHYNDGFVQFENFDKLYADKSEIKLIKLRSGKYINIFSILNCKLHYIGDNDYINELTNNEIFHYNYINGKCIDTGDWFTHPVKIRYDRNKKLKNL